MLEKNGNIDLSKWNLIDVLIEAEEDIEYGKTILGNLLMHCPNRHACIKEVHYVMRHLKVHGSQCHAMSKEFFEQRIAWGNEYYDPDYYMEICGTKLDNAGQATAPEIEA